ncbi:MAG: SpoIIE family protein phosphatase [Candidatus Riflebacteria bacterium]|nr:SpoIIE family protein phosphatase [Candidatus Riflebacteria bacterium]
MDPSVDLRGFLDRLTQPVALLTRGHTVRQANPAFASLFGRTPEALVGTVLDDLLPNQSPSSQGTPTTAGGISPSEASVLLSIRPLGEPTRFFPGHLVRWPTSGDPLFGLVLTSPPPAPTPTTDPDNHLHHRLEMERVVCAISSELMKAGPGSFDTRILNALGELGTGAGVDQANIHLFSDDGTAIARTFRWSGSATPPRRSGSTGLHLAGFPWSMEAYRRGEPLLIPSLTTIPREGEAERRLWEATGLKSKAVLPLMANGRLLGTIGFDSFRMEKHWTTEDLRLLRLTAELFALAFIRWEALEAADRSSARYRTLARNFPDGLVLLYNRRMKVVLADGRDLERMGLPSGLRQLAGEADRGNTQPADPCLVMDALPQPVFDRLVPYLRAALQGETHLVEIPFRQDFYEVHLLPVRGGNEEIIGGMAVFQRITARKKTEENLRHATHLLITLIEHLSSGILVEDGQHVIQFLNQRFREMFPTDERLVHLPFAAPAPPLIPMEPAPPPANALPEAWRALFTETATTTGTGEFRLDDGRIMERDRIPLEVDGESLGHLWEFRDVTAARMAERAVREAHEREILIAGEIHRELLVGRPPGPRPGAEVAVLSRPSMHVDGDLVDFFPDNDHLLDVLVGDVMGKGIPAALIAAATRLAFLRARSRLATVRHGSPPHPETILGFVHTEIAAHLGTLTSFVTLVFARLDMQARLLFVVNCGHPPVLLLKGETGEVISLASGNPALGIGQRPYFQGITCPYVPGDLLVFLSDGVTEARRADGQMFGLPRVIAEIQRRWQEPVQLMVDGLAAAVEAFLEGEPLQDDCTCVILRLSDLKHP